MMCELIRDHWISENSGPLDRSGCKVGWLLAAIPFMPLRLKSPLFRERSVTCFSPFLSVSVFGTVRMNCSCLYTKQFLLTQCSQALQFVWEEFRQSLIYILSKILNNLEMIFTYSSNLFESFCSNLELVHPVG